MTVSETKLAADVLQRAFWRAIEEIGPYPSSSFDRIAVPDDYAKGVEHTLIDALEHLHGMATHNDDPCLRLDCSAWAGQLEAAAGECFRRRNPYARSCKGRKFNAWLTQIRDWRIVLWAGDASMFVRTGPRKDAPATKLEREIERYDPKRDLTLPEQDQWRRAQREARALRALYMHLLPDRDWYRKVAEHHKARAALTNEMEKTEGGQ